MRFKCGYIYVCTLSMCITSAVNSAEWKTEPSLNLRLQYEDNPTRLPDNVNSVASTGYTIDPRVKFSGIEQNVWDLSIDARGKVTRFQDVEDADSDNAFFVFDAGRQTERTDWRLNASFERNSDFDTDFDTQNPGSSLLDDHTERKTRSISPSVSWSMSEISKINFSLSSTDVSFDEVARSNYQDYDLDSVNFNVYWLASQNHQLGFTSSYTEYKSSEADFFYDQSVLQFDYTYTVDPTSNIGFSLGGRWLDSTRTNVTTGCVANGNTIPIEQVSLIGVCPDTIAGFPVTPVLDDISNSDDGVVTNLTYTSKTETTSHRFVGGRTVSPSSFAGAQEVRSATYQLSVKNTERLTTALILNASESITLNGTISSRLNDTKRYRFEPSVSYRLTNNWNLQLLYRYINESFTISDIDSTSNAVYVNLFLHWPKLATTY